MGGTSLEDALVRLGYADGVQIMKAKAEQFGMDFVDLHEIEIPATVVELVPESVARDNVVMPLSLDKGAIKVIMHDPMDFDTIDKLRFVLNKEIEVALAPKEAIVEAINRYYGSTTTETESVDSMLQEFTDTAIGLPRRRRRGPRRLELQHPGGGGCPDHPPRPPDHPGGRQQPGFRHPHRALRRPGPHPLPDRRRLHRARLPAPPPPRPDRQPHQDHGPDRHRREAPPPGRPGQDPRGRQGYRPACQHPPDQSRSVGRHADPGPGEHQGRPEGPRVRRRGLEEVPDPHQAAQRHPAGDRPDRLGQDDDALRRPERTEPPRCEDHHRRGPGRILPARDQPVRGPGQDRHDLRADHPGHAPAKSEHPARRRDPR